MTLRIQDAAFDPGFELNAFTAAARSAGAVVSFSGIVRDEAGKLAALEIEHYPAMTNVAIQKIMAEARARWDLTEVLVIHRHGRIATGEVIMMVATAARHRIAAFEAAEFLMDYLKSRAPFWKKEIMIDGRDGEWVEAKAQDEAALDRWSK